MIIPEQTIYELKSLKLILAWEWSYESIEAREAVIDRLKYSISDTIITILLNETR